MSAKEIKSIEIVNYIEEVLFENTKLFNKAVEEVRTEIMRDARRIESYEDLEDFKDLIALSADNENHEKGSPKEVMKEEIYLNLLGKIEDLDLEIKEEETKATNKDFIEFLKEGIKELEKPCREFMGDNEYTYGILSVLEKQYRDVEGLSESSDKVEISPEEAENILRLLEGTAIQEKQTSTNNNEEFREGVEEGFRKINQYYKEVRDKLDLILEETR